MHARRDRVHAPRAPRGDARPQGFCAFEAAAAEHGMLDVFLGPNLSLFALGSAARVKSPFATNGGRGLEFASSLFRFVLLLSLLLLAKKFKAVFLVVFSSALIRDRDGGNKKLDSRIASNRISFLSALAAGAASSRGVVVMHAPHLSLLTADAGDEAARVRGIYAAIAACEHVECSNIVVDGYAVSVAQSGSAATAASSQRLLRALKSQRRPPVRQLAEVIASLPTQRTQCDALATAEAVAALSDAAVQQCAQAPVLRPVAAVSIAAAIGETALGGGSAPQYAREFGERLSMMSVTASAVYNGGSRRGAREHPALSALVALTHACAASRARPAQWPRRRWAVLRRCSSTRTCAAATST